MTKQLLIIAYFILIASAISAGDWQTVYTADLTDSAVRDDQVLTHPPFEPSGAWHHEEAEFKGKRQLDKSFYEKILAQGPQSYDQDNYDVGFYDVYMRIDDTTQSFFGRVKFIARATVPNLTEILVDLWADRGVDSIVAPSGPLSYSRNGDLITVTLDHAYDIDEQFEFDIWYYQIGNDYYGLSWSGGIAGSFAEPYWAPAWWPCKDELTDKADSMKIAFEVDTSFYAASNGTLDSVVAAGDNTHTYHYTEHYPIATYLFSVVAGELMIFNQVYTYDDGNGFMLITNAITPDVYDTAVIALEITPNVLAVFSEAFGEYPFVEEKYGHGNAPSGGGMEHQTMTTMGNSWIVRADVIIHEAAHQWWGDMITCGSWSDIWLNEGMATWSEGIYWRAMYGEAYYYNYMSTIEYTGSGTVFCDDTTNVGRIFSPNLSYYKGAWVMYMLHYVLGDTLFFAGMHSYYDSPHKYGTAVTEDFKNIMESATGVELDYFFDQWVFGEYCPNYYYYYTSQPSDSAGYEVYVVVEQVQTTRPQVFITPLEIGVYPESSPGDTVRVWSDKRRNHYKLNIASDIIPYGIWLDPCNRVLAHENRQDEWTMFLTTVQEELSDGKEGILYNDTIDVLGGSGDCTWSVISGALPPGCTIDNEGLISGVTTVTGTHQFTVRVVDNIEGHTDEYSFSIYVAPADCCGEFSEGFTGNVNRSTDGKATLSDITMLIDNVFISKTPLECPGDGNVNGSVDEKITLSDITRLIDHVFISKASTEPCL